MSETSEAGKAEDLTGRGRLTRNVAYAWGGLLVNVLSGFILPRMISDHLGRNTLGLWDFAWSTLGYFGLLQLGIGASAERYVARHRARGDTEALSKSASTIGLSFLVSGLLVLIMTVLTALFGLDLFAARLGDEVTTCRWVILFLGFELGLCMMLAIYGGVIAGCHRWDIHNSITASNYALATVGMLAVLPLGFGLRTLAAIHCFFSVSAEIVRWRLARRVCPELRINYCLASGSVWLEQFRFSVKNLIPRIADLISSQTFSLLIVGGFGPAMLAIYSRPKSLLYSLQKFAAKFGFILIPTASALQASSDHAALRCTLGQSSHFISCLALPAILTLIVLGDRVIQLWMGSGYVCAGLVSVLSVSSFFTIVQESVWSILSGLNRHGRVGYFKLAGAIGSVAALAVVLFWLKWGLVGVALAFAVPQMVVDGLVTPTYACRCLGMSLGSYYRQVLCKPLWWCSSYLGALLLARFALQFNPWLAASLWAAGLLSLVWIYWLVVVPAAMRQSILGRLPFFRTRIRSGVVTPATTED